MLAPQGFSKCVVGMLMVGGWGGNIGMMNQFCPQAQASKSQGEQILPLGFLRICHPACHIELEGEWVNTALGSTAPQRRWRLNSNHAPPSRLRLMCLSPLAHAGIWEAVGEALEDGFVLDVK
jgi:hypothetical protein